MTMKFAIWGVGIRGQRLFDIIGENRAEVFIESNAAFVSQTCRGIMVIDFEEYMRKYSHLFIIITPMFAEEEIIKTLKEHNIFRYFRLSECPPEFYGMDTPRIFDNFPLRLDVNRSYAIWGITLYSILLYDYLKEKGYRRLSIIPQDCMDSGQYSRLLQLLPDYNIAEDWIGDKTAEILVGMQCALNLAQKYGIADDKVLNAFDFSDVFPEYYHSSLEQYKDLYKDKRCFIVATGPSLKMEDLNILREKKEICFGMNQLYLAYDKTSWRPDFYVFSDFLVLGANLEEINNFDSGEVLFLMDDNEYTDRMKDKDNVYEYHLQKEEYFDRFPKFSMNAARKMYRGYTVTYVCLQLAVYMGFKEIYLIGCDCTNYGKKYWNSNDSHFCSEYGKNRTGFVADTHDKVILAYQSARRHAEAVGVTIYNATRGGELEVFERVSFDKLMTDEKEENAHEM